MAKKSLKRVLDENEDNIELDDGMSFDESWDLSAGIMVRQDIRDGGALKLAKRLAKRLTRGQLLELVHELEHQKAGKE